MVKEEDIITALEKFLHEALGLKGRVYIKGYDMRSEAHGASSLAVYYYHVVEDKK